MSQGFFAIADAGSRKADAALYARDEAHLARVVAAIDWQLADLRSRLADEFAEGGGAWQGAVEREQRIVYLQRRIRLLERYGSEMCLGHVTAQDGAVTYVGRLGVVDADGERLLYDWRSGAAEPFFGATAAHPMGMRSRRRYRWKAGRVADYWDEPLQGEAAAEASAALDDDSALMTSLAASRSARMRDVLATIQSDQDAIVRAPSRGVLVVDGGPGTGKTVVALHRAAYLNYADARLRAQGGNVLVVGPHRPYLRYIEDVLPGLGEDSVHACTMRDLVPEGAAAATEPPETARLKATLDRAVDAAVRLYEQPPTDSLVVDAGQTEVMLTAADWALAFDAPAQGTPHNLARLDVWEALLTAVARHVLGDDLEDAEAADDFDAYAVEEVSAADEIRRAASRDQGLRDAVSRAWPALDPREIVGDLWSVPAYLRMCAPWLTAEQAQSLQRTRPDAWTDADLPILDAAIARIGARDALGARASADRARAAERERMSQVVSDLMEHDDSDMHVMSMLRGQDLRGMLDAEPEPEPGAGGFAGPYAHVIVDEAQELTPAEWRSLMRRCPSGSFTVVGDRAQARAGFPEPWQERLAAAGLTEASVATLRVNYRTPAEVMEVAEPAIRAALPDANVPVSARASGRQVGRGAVASMGAVIEDWLDSGEEGVACVISRARVTLPDDAPPGRVVALTPELSKGLEFDLVVVVGANTWGDAIVDAVDRYVAMTRSTGRLVLLDG